MDGSRARVPGGRGCRAPIEHPASANPIITDTCIPIEAQHASLQVLGALALYTANFSQNWRPVSPKGDLYTLSMPVKFTYGPAENLETYIIAPCIVNWVNNVDRSVAGPNGERSASYAGLGDITTVAKYLVLEEGEIYRRSPWWVGLPGPAATPPTSTPGSWWWEAAPMPRHRSFHFHHRRQPIQMGETIPAVQQRLVEQPG